MVITLKSKFQTLACCMEIQTLASYDHIYFLSKNWKFLPPNCLPNSPSPTTLHTTPLSSSNHDTPTHYHCIYKMRMTGKSSVLPSQACVEQRKELNQNHCTRFPKESEHNYIKNLTEPVLAVTIYFQKCLTDLSSLQQPSLVCIKLRKGFCCSCFPV